MLRTLDSSSSSTYDSEANPMLSVHLQARLSADESSTDLETGVHNSWRLSAWSKKLHGASLFTLNEDEGQIEIPEDGLYLVYAQVIKNFIFLSIHFMSFFRSNIWMSILPMDLKLM